VQAITRDYLAEAIGRLVMTESAANVTKAQKMRTASSAPK
jgi:hypothetical protein